MSREAFQEWDYILSQNGASIDSLGTAMNNLRKSAEGTSKNGAEALRRLGIAAEGMTNEQVFDAAITALQGIEDESERASIANELFGKSYQDLMPLINSTSEATNGLRQSAHELGLVMQDDAIDQGVTLGDTLDSLKRSFGAIFTQLGTDLMPVVQQVANFLLKAMPPILGIVSELSPILVNLGQMLAPLLEKFASEIFPLILDLIMELLPFVEQIIEQLLPVFFEILSLLLPIVTEIISKLLPVLMQVLTNLMPAISSILRLLGPILELIMLLLSPLLDLINLILPPLSKLLGSIGTFLGDKLSAFIQKVVDKFKEFKSVIDKVKEWLLGFKDKWVEIWQSVSNFFKNIWDGIKEFFKAPLNWIIGKLNEFIRWVNRIQIPEWVPVVGGKGFHLNEIPQLAEGGDIRQPGTVLVGERGPEMLNLPRGAKVTPLDRAGGLTVNINGATVMRPDDVDWLGDLIVDRLRERGISHA